MFTKLIFAFALIGSSQFLLAAGIQGQYSNEKEVIVFSENRSSCENDGGSWQMDQETCLFEAMDKVIVKKKGKEFEIQVNTVGSNFHTCEFIAPAKLNQNTLIASALSEEYNPKSGQLIEVLCEIKATIENNRLQITSNQHCQSFCGANAGLEVKLLLKENK